MICFIEFKNIVPQGWKNQNTCKTCSHSIDVDILILILLLLSTTYPVLANSVDPDQLASEEANWSGSALFAIKYVNL